MSDDAFRLAWFVINVVSIVIAFTNVIDAWQDWRAVVRLEARIAARATVRRETVRIVIVGALLLALIVSNPVVFFTVPIGMALNSYMDSRVRRTLANKIEADLAREALAISTSIQATVDDTAQKVDDIHEATVKG